MGGSQHLNKTNLYMISVKTTEKRKITEDL